jgi:muramoyltetrapeptide carboxypeptidase
MNVIKPFALEPGQTIGIVSPSWFGGRLYERRANRGIAQLERLGYRVRVGQYAFENDGWVSASVDKRVADIHAMFGNPDVRAIFATIGGDHSSHLLPYLDWNLIRQNPKIFMGFSDITVLNNAINRETGLVTFNGPALMTEWAEFPDMPDYSRNSVLGMITRPEPCGLVSPASSWTEEFLDWETGADETRPRKQTASSGWQWLREGVAKGPLVGGCLESLQHLRGTRWWPDLEGAILFLETSEERPSPPKVDGLLMDLENMGELNKIAGLIVARPYGYSDTDRVVLHQVIIDRTSKWSIPVLADVDAGHTSPILTLPIGCMVRLDSRIEGFELLEAAVQ